jgi:hypothetical protein
MFEQIFVVCNSHKEKPIVEYFRNYFKTSNEKLLNVPKVFVEAWQESDIERYLSVFENIAPSGLNIFTSNYVLIFGPFRPCREESSKLLDDSFCQKFSIVISEYEKIMSDNDVIFIKTGDLEGKLSRDSKPKDTEILFASRNAIDKMYKYLKKIDKKIPCDNLWEDMIKKTRITSYVCK